MSGSTSRVARLRFLDAVELDWEVEPWLEDGEVVDDAGADADALVVIGVLG